MEQHLKSIKIVDHLATLLEFIKHYLMNYLVLYGDFKLFYGSHSRKVQNHSHPIIQLVFSLKDTFRSKDDSGQWISKKGLLIAPNYPHECDASNTPIISVEIDVESSLGEWILLKHLTDQSIVDYPSKELGAIDGQRFTDHLSNESWPALRNMIENVFGFQKLPNLSEKDDRIQDVVNFIKKNIDQKNKPETLADVARLSESRLLHLFKEEMGLPIRKYIQWLRLQIVIDQIFKGNSLTSAAYKAGFSDQAHMTRTFSKMVGVPPSLISKNSNFVQVSISPKL